MQGTLPLRGQYPDWIFYFVSLAKYLNRASNPAPLYKTKTAIQAVFSVRDAGLEPATLSV